MQQNFPRDTAIRRANGSKVTPIDMAAIMASISQVDEVARASETTWGVSRLVRLVSEETVLKFKSLHDRWTTAYSQTRDPTETARLGASMIRAYAALHAEAITRGHQPLTTAIWEAATPDGRVLVVVQTQEEAHAVVRAEKEAQQASGITGRELTVWTMPELARVIGSLETVQEIKRQFPGAKVSASTPRDPALLADWITESPEVVEMLHGEDVP